MRREIICGRWDVWDEQRSTARGKEEGIQSDRAVRKSIIFIPPFSFQAVTCTVS